jgi:hypothetical protein
VCVHSAWGRVLNSVQRPTTQADVLQKFRKMTVARFSTTAQHEMIALCERLETVEDATTLVALMDTGVLTSYATGANPARCLVQ